jgi:type I restriction enzyme, S subunit
MSVEKIDLNNLDKSNWKTYRFDEIAKNISERIDPNNTELEVYIGLGHIDSESLHIKRHGTPDDVNGQKLKFYKGDMIFGRRRAYQRKAGIATCDGFCSAHALVLRANSDLIEPELFPFFLHSDLFMNRAVDISVGSLSPTINWGTLKHQEFLIPSLDQQKKLVELLITIDIVIQMHKATLDKINVFKHSFRKDVFEGSDSKLLQKNLRLVNKPDWIVSTVKEVCEIQNNLRKPISKEIRRGMQGLYPYYGPTSVFDHINEYRVDGEYVLIGEDGDHFLKYSDWSMTQYVTGKFNVNNHAHIIKGTESCLTKWVFYSLQHRNVKPLLTKQGATRYKLNKESLLNIPLLIPPVLEQKKLISEFDLIEESMDLIQSKISSTIKLSQSLINQVF